MPCADAGEATRTAAPSSRKHRFDFRSSWIVTATWRFTMAAFTLADLKVITDACVGGDSGLGPETVDTPFEELDIDSLAVYEIVTRVEESLHFGVTDDEIDLLHTGQQILDFVNTKLTGVSIG
jgi:acyl carrier protein